MNIQNGKRKLKEITVEDIAFKDRQKNKVFMQNNNREEVDNEVFKKEAEGMTKNFTSELELRKNYNSSLTELDPRYTNLTPIDSYIVRMYVLEDEIKKLGSADLIIPTATFTRKQTNSGRLGDKIADPFRFKQMAVIVAVPSYETNLKPGMVVQVVPPTIIADDIDVVGFEYQYVHPDYPYPMVPKNVDNKDFGYSIIPKQRIKVIVK